MKLYYQKHNFFCINVKCPNVHKSHYTTVYLTALYSVLSTDSFKSLSLDSVTMSFRWAIELH